MQFMATLIVVDNIEKSRQFYEKVLGQTIKIDFGENVTFVGDFAIHQKKHFKTLINDKAITIKSNSSELYFEHDDLVPLVETIKSLGLEFVHEIVEQPWRQQVIRFYDYDKNLIEVGERMEHLAYRLSKEGKSIEEISKITYMEKADVTLALKEFL